MNSINLILFSYVNLSDSFQQCLFQRLKYLFFFPLNWIMKIFHLPFFFVGTNQAGSKNKLIP